MCLAIPARVVEVDRDAATAVVSLGGVRKEVSTMLVEDVAVDDYVLIHVGFALNKIDQEEAERTLALFAQAGLVDGS
ncbi:MAG: HypC/HybG/HupF family hydrogenase formation chaperone [Thiohalomonadaceae bacterium]|jgi:hydrogenase expression/formation protein HypC